MDAADLVLTDPPYGIGADRAHKGRANTQRGKSLWTAKDYGGPIWDDTPPDADTIDMVRNWGVNAIVWGGNHFQLPPARCWLVWDKDNGTNKYADCELAWTNLDKAVRMTRYKWHGMFQEHAGRNKETRYHPTQKPVAVMMWCIEQAPRDIKMVLDPFMGSGTTLVAAKRMGLECVGIEIEERYCEIAANRLGQGVLDFEGPA